jgi:hypothetical protein
MYGSKDAALQPEKQILTGLMQITGHAGDAHRQPAAHPKGDSFMVSEKEIIDKAIAYKKKGVRPLTLDRKNEMYLWFYSVWDNMEKTLLPQIRERGEKLVEFYPSCFLFGELTSPQQGVAEKRLDKNSPGTYASGCIGFTNKNIYFVALQAVTQKYPLFKSGPGGFSRALFEGIFGKVNEKEAYPGDRTWAVNYASIVEAQITKLKRRGRELLDIQTASVEWQIYDEPALLEEMLAITKMGLEGKFSRL